MIASVGVFGCLRRMIKDRTIRREGFVCKVGGSSIVRPEKTVRGRPRVEPPGSMQTIEINGPKGVDCPGRARESSGLEAERQNGARGRGRRSEGSSVGVNL